MHCAADLGDETDASQYDVDRKTDGSTGEMFDSADEPQTAESAGDELLDPDGTVDNTLTVAVAIVSGVVIGIASTVVAAFLLGGGVGLLVGLLVWLGATAIIARQRTVQGAISLGGYSVATVFLSMPLVAFSPATNVEGGVEGRLVSFLLLLVFALVPAGIAATIGWFADRFVPEDLDTVS
jgi:hypothetical protein